MHHPHDQFHRWQMLIMINHPATGCVQALAFVSIFQMIFVAILASFGLII